MPHFAIINEDDDVYMFGDNLYGQLGLGDCVNRETPTKLQNMPKISSTGTGTLFTVLLDVNGDVWICGLLGKPQEAYLTPHKLMENHKIVGIACGLKHILLLDDEGSVFSCGSNENGQLGNQLKTTTLPCKIDDIPKIKKIYAGQYFSFLIDVNGLCWSFGLNNGGQLGRKPSYSYYGRNLSESLPDMVHGIKDIVAASCGDQQTFLIDHEGSTYYCGNNQYKIEKVKVTEPIFRIISRDDYTLLLDINNDVWFCSYDYINYPGRNWTRTRFIRTPIKIYSGIVDMIKFQNSIILITENRECLSLSNGFYDYLAPQDIINRLEPTKIEGVKCRVKCRKF